MNLNEIQFPIYVLGHYKPDTEDGIIYYHRTNGVFIVDDTKIDKPTLAERRLVLLDKGVKLHKIDKGIFFLGDFIKISKPSIWFIDSTGKVFNHKKRVSLPLIFKKIKSIQYSKGAYVIEVQDIPQRFKTLYAPTGKEYAGLLCYGLGYILYGLYDQEYKKSRKMI